MLGGIQRRAAESLGALRQVLGNGDLRRLQLGFAGAIVGYWALAVAVAVYAYNEGGTTLVAIAGVARYVPAALAAPFASALADRYPRQRVMVISDLIRAAALAVVAVAVALSLPAARVIVLVAVNSTVGSVFRPALAALLPGLAGDPRDLTAANVVSTMIESAGILVGPRWAACCWRSPAARSSSPPLPGRCCGRRRW